MSKTDLILIFALFLNSEIAFSQTRICKIIFNEKDGLYNLERKVNRTIDYQNSDNDDIFKCYKIGVEHNQNKIPINNSPIYACCKNQ